MIWIVNHLQKELRVKVWVGKTISYFMIRLCEQQIHQLVMCNRISILLPSPSSITTGPSISTLIVTMRENHPRVDAIVIIVECYVLSR